MSEKPSYNVCRDETEPFKTLRGNQDTLNALLALALGGAFFNFGHSRGGLNREGSLLENWAYSQNQMTLIRMIAFQFFYSIFRRFNIQFYESNT